MHLAHVFRWTLSETDKNWWGLPSDSFAIDLAFGGLNQHPYEWGGFARVELRAYYLSAGVMFTQCTKTEDDWSFPISLRFGF
ncbi:MAG: hypothetical protein A2341_18425 [Deltaproteobacteria bacterium RIFOXYB12_FULL_58_9]|nr:MAG: hypothetical protein A2341_18425 [Deltaproteobacteria bacterium RIFOXYB12_FULL_58_9]